MKFLKKHAGGLVLCLGELLVGILLLINPVGFTSRIIGIAGIVLMVMGLVEVIRYFRTEAKEAALGQRLVKGLLFLLVGGFCALRTEWFLATFPALTIVYGVVILITGIGKVQQMMDMLRQKNKKWFWAAINAVVSIACALVILRSPFSSTVALWVFTGASLIAEAVLDVFTLILGRKAEKEQSDDK